MPELPEVETTVRALNRNIKNLRIFDIWTNYDSNFYKGKNNIKNRQYFKKFKKKIVGKKFINAERRAKNILIHLEGGISILVHMKMTGHFLLGKYEKKIENKNGKTKILEWKPKDKFGALNDPMNRFIRLVFVMSNGKHLAFSDLRKFAKIFCFSTKEKNILKDLKNIGPEPLAKNFGLDKFKKQLLKKPNGKIKQVLMDQSIIAGIGNIYSDEVLWETGVHPLSLVSKIPDEKLGEILQTIKKILKSAINSGGDSMSDFRQINGQKGNFQNFHKVYRKTGEKCKKSRCYGKIARVKVGGRSAHFCPIHQKSF